MRAKPALRLDPDHAGERAGRAGSRWGGVAERYLVRAPAIFRLPCGAVSVFCSDCSDATTEDFSSAGVDRDKQL
jgi:hypothetical protein